MASYTTLAQILMLGVILVLVIQLVASQEERKVMRRRKLLPDSEPVDLVNQRIYKQLNSRPSTGDNPDNQRSFGDVAQSRIDEPEAGKVMKVRRKKQHHDSQILQRLEDPSPRVSAVLSEAAQRPLRKKKTIVVPSYLLTTTSTTTPTPPFETANNRTEEESRFLSLFTVIRFKNEACKSGSGSNGTCYSSGDCTANGGTPSGSCAQGFGVCCLFTRTCSESTSTNGTYFQNKAYPSTFDQVGSCQLTVNKCNDNICQLRLDFQNFMLSQPDSTDNQCRFDQFIVSGGSSPIPAICGTNSGQHIYVDMGLAYNNPVTLTVVSSGGSGNTRSFSIKVTQIECTSLNRAPDSCLQYYQGVTGTLMTFNYMDAAGLMLSNNDYTMCIRSERNFCGIQYTACPDTVNVPPTINNQVNTMNVAMSFSVTGGSPAVGSIIGTNCATDWVTIPCSTNTMDVNLQTGTPAVCVDRICGMVFNSVTTAAGSPNVAVNSYVKPFTVHVHTNAIEGSSTPAETRNRGFCLKYVQQPCTSTG